MHKYVPKRFKQYETIYILHPQITQSSNEIIVKKIQSIMEQYGGKITRVSLWGLRRLAYKIKHQSLGIYYQLNFIAPQGFVEEMEKYFRVNDNILRYLTVSLSEEPVNPDSIIVKEGDVNFGTVEGLSREPVEEAAKTNVEEIEGGMEEDESLEGPEEDEEFLDEGPEEGEGEDEGGEEEDEEEG